MVNILDQGFRKARKNYYCDGCQYIKEDVRELGLPACTGITKGDLYYFQVNTLDGIGTFRCCLTCNENANKHNLVMNDDYY